MKPIYILLTLFSTKVIANQADSNLLIIKKDGVIKSDGSWKAIAKDKHVNLKFNNGIISIIWGRNNKVKNIDLATLQALSTRTKNSNIIIGVLSGKQIIWQALIKGTGYNWQTYANSNQGHLKQAITHIKHHLNPEKNYIPVTVKIQSSTKEWPMIQKTLKTICKGSNWKIVAANDKNITLRSEVKDKFCVSGLNYKLEVRYDTKNI